MTVPQEQDMTIVLVHLGKKPDVHFWRNLEKIASDFPAFQVVGIINQGMQIRNNFPSRISFFEYIPEVAVDEIFSRHKLDHNFRDGFWRFTIERLFAVIQFHKLHPSKKLLHVESDVLILPNFPFGTICQSNEILWCRFNESKDVSTLLYLPNLSASITFEKKLFNALGVNNKHTDMTLLSYLAREDSTIRIFPTFNSKFPELANSLNKSLDFSEYSNCTSGNFSGIFDSAAMGMWLTGIDPRNYYGITKIHDRGIIDNGDSYVDPSKYNYSFEEDCRLFLTNNGVKLEVFCLHIHSKNLKIFGENWKKELTRYTIQSSQKKTLFEFNLIILIKLIFINIRQKTLVSFIGGIPIVQTLRRNARRMRT